MRSHGEVEVLSSEQREKSFANAQSGEFAEVCGSPTNAAHESSRTALPGPSPKDGALSRILLISESSFFWGLLASSSAALQIFSVCLQSKGCFAHTIS